MPKRQLPYTYRDRNSTLYLRFTIGLNIRALLPGFPRDIRLSLCTKQLRVARAILPRLLHDIDAILSDLIDMPGRDESDFQRMKDELQRKRDGYLEELPARAALKVERGLDELERLRRQQQSLEYWRKELQEEADTQTRVNRKKLQALEVLSKSQGGSLSAAAIDDHVQRDQGVADRLAERLRDVGEKITALGCRREQLNHELPEQVLSDTFTAQAEGRGDASRLAVVATLSQVHTVESERLSVLIEKYIQSRQGQAKEKTLLEKQGSFKLFMYIVGDVVGSELSADHLDRFAKVLPTVPANITKKMSASGRSFQEVMAQGLPPRAITTVNNVFGDVRTVLTWLKRRGKVTVDPGLLQNLIPTTRDDESNRRPWEVSELQTLFNGYIWRYDSRAVGKARSNEKVTDHYFWVPLVCLFTGARLEEVCSLKPDEVTLVDGVWCFDMPYYDKITGKVIKKNRASGRVIPVHSELQRIGLIQYAERRRELGADMLFDGVELQEGKYSQATSKWFGRTLKKKLGLPVGDNSAVLHSMRNNVVDLFERQAIEESKYSRVTGHTVGATARKMYADKSGKPYPPQELVPFIESIRFEGLDLSHVQYDQFRERFRDMFTARARAKKMPA